MIISGVSAGKFAAGWLPAMAVSAVLNPVPEAAYIALDLGGVEVPVVTALLAAFGVLAARPLARREESKLSLGQFVLVSAIMLVVVELWVIEMRPRWLFAFVVAIGLGFSGYSLIELLGKELKELVSAGFRAVRRRIGGLIGLPDEDRSTAEAEPFDPSDEFEEMSANGGGGYRRNRPVRRNSEQGDRYE
ncbi:hypothetical protein D2V17_14295 [Aurantiacibacter xanthus]|uniref:Uncharacterized protein n=1 Tax=Aurantiacibacter xanthus TaxID=1784712 RepID=A0A3A1P5U8_9SPHN|nr:hypothetical protein [Aurantiacibacter xanthus]RIV82969.1 hypothetical protein D2V17_14295 [Aurantiacibacter xanthus]